jgi:pSer/pThr/pTyr-binding forkhead associated (FHA) protein
LPVTATDTDTQFHTHVPTQETGTLPRIPDRERRRAAVLPQLPPGRYLAIEDAGEVVLMRLTGDVVRVGRSSANDIVLDDASVSRRHALLARRGETTVVLDDRSLNGVRVNGERVSEAPLRDGDALLLGHVALRYVERA